MSATLVEETLSKLHLKTDSSDKDIQHVIEHLNLSISQGEKQLDIHREDFLKLVFSLKKFGKDLLDVSEEFFGQYIQLLSTSEATSSTAAQEERLANMNQYIEMLDTQGTSLDKAVSIFQLSVQYNAVYAEVSSYLAAISSVHSTLKHDMELFQAMLKDEAIGWPGDQDTKQGYQVLLKFLSKWTQS